VQPRVGWTLVTPDPPHAGCYDHFVKLRIAAGVAACSILAIVACGTILDLDESGPDPNAADSGEGEGGDDDGHVVIEPIPDARCSPETCGAIGGTCVEGACRLGCVDGGCQGTIVCPENTDCQIDCLGEDACTNLTCSGGRSCSFYCEGSACFRATCSSTKCSFDCGGNDACQRATCTGDECTFRCLGRETCENIACNAKGSCKVECTGNDSCESASCAAESCTFDCKGNGSCPGRLQADAGTCAIKCETGACRGTTLSCGRSKTASIVCADQACSEAKPTCVPPSGGTCQILCGKDACKAACCFPDAGGDCRVDGGKFEPRECGR